MGHLRFAVRVVLLGHHQPPVEELLLQHPTRQDVAVEPRGAVSPAPNLSSLSLSPTPKSACITAVRCVFPPVGPMHPHDPSFEVTAFVSCATTNQSNTAARAGTPLSRPVVA